MLFRSELANYDPNLQVAARASGHYAGPVHLNFPLAAPLKPDFPGADMQAVLRGARDCFSLGARAVMPARRKGDDAVPLTVGPLLGSTGQLSAASVAAIEEALRKRPALVVVGEGIVNQSSIYGKAMAGIGMLCKAREIPVVAVVGSMERGAEQLYHYGIHSMAACVNAVMEQAYVVENAEELLSHAAERLFRLLIVGMRMQTGENCLADIQTRKYRREEEPQGIQIGRAHV